MAKAKCTFPVEKPYKNVARSNTNTNSSVNSPDVLSYSYSCVQAFKKNQNIIGNLAERNKDAKYHGLIHEPAIFSLSGDQKNQFNQLYYSSSGAESEKTGNLHNYTGEHLSTNSFQSSTNFQCNSESSFCDKLWLVQWLRYQIKCINSLWPFYKSGVGFFSKICSRQDQKMKMEMLLNNIDEEMKYRLKQYVNDLNLSLKENYNACNESVIEIDVTPLMDDTNRFQSFIEFLKNLQSNESKVVEDRYILSHPQPSKFSQSKVILKPYSNNHVHTINRSDDKTFNNQENKICINYEPLCLNYEPLPQGLDSLHHPPNIKTHNYHERYYNTDNPAISFIYPSKNNQSKQHWTEEVKQFCGNCEYGQKLSIAQDKYQINKILGENNKSPLNANVYDRLKSNQCEEKRVNIRTISPSKLKTGGNKPLANEQEPYSNKKSPFIQDLYYAEGRPISQQRGNISFCEKDISYELPCMDNISCKCLMHQKREDYNRYRNQCLFGQGDENTNSSIKEIALREENSQTKANSAEIPTRDTTTNKLENSEEALYSSKTVNIQKGVKNRFLVAQSQTQTRKNKKQSNIMKPLSCDSKLNLKNVVDTSKTDVEDYSMATNKFGKDEFSEKPISSNVKNSAKECNSNKSYLGSKEYQVVRVEDVEELVCEVNYSDSNVSTTSSHNRETNSSNKTQEKHSSEDFSYKKISINACFESLNYSLNSFAPNNSPKALQSTSVEQKNSCTTDQTQKMSAADRSSDSVISCYPVLIELPQKRNNYVDNECERDRTKVSTEKNNSQNDHMYNLKYIKTGKKSKHKEYFCDKRASTCSDNLKNQWKNKQNKISVNYPYNKDSQEIESFDKKQNRIEIVVQNANELQTNITDLNKKIICLPIRKQEVISEHENSNNTEVVHDSDSKLSCSKKKMSMVIKITSDESQLNSEHSSRSNKKHRKLHFLKPKKVYSNISSVFKRRGEKLQNTNKSKESIKSSKKEIISTSLILNNLEKLFSEIRQQREDIISMKKILYTSNK